MALNEQCDNRFLLGVGVSHAALVTDLCGHAYGKPVATMRRYLEAMKTQRAGHTRHRCRQHSR
jgi:alkanesulfonate monooxygenase SsuD/methylene tetrahydromethanopterin reductase-like flavin-dependent oxidoreductase (luciferase family)